MTPPVTATAASPPAPTATGVVASGAPVSGELAGTAAQRLVLVTAPANGRFHPQIGQGRVGAGDVIARISGGRRPTIQVCAPVDVMLRGSLCRPGQLVRTGDALLWGEAAAEPEQSSPVDGAAVVQP